MEWKPSCTPAKHAARLMLSKRSSTTQGFYGVFLMKVAYFKRSFDRRSVNKLPTHDMNIKLPGRREISRVPQNITYPPMPSINICGARVSPTMVNSGLSAIYYHGTSVFDFSIRLGNQPRSYQLDRDSYIFPSVFRVASFLLLVNVHQFIRM